jgi:hypothetical protein
LIASNEPLPDLEASIAVGMSPHLAGWTDNEGCAHLVAFLWLPLCIAHHLPTTPGTFPTGLLWVDPAGDDAAFMVGLVFGVSVDAPLHPESSIHSASVTIVAFLRFQIAEVLKD